MFALWRHRLKARTDTATLVREKAHSDDPAERDKVQQRLGRPTRSRPPGPLLWIHRAWGATPTAIALLVSRLREERGPLAIVLTSDDPGSIIDIPGAILQSLPADTDDATQGFLAHWAPDACLWVGGNWAPVLLANTAARRVPAICVDTRLDTVDTRLWQGPLAQGALAAFEQIQTGSQGDARRLLAAGARPNQVDSIGWLEASSGALPCNDTDWTTLGATLGARPLWLAATVPEPELLAVLQAHRLASRLAHRLLLVLNPLNSNDGPLWRDQLESEGWQTALRSADEEPSETTQIFLADMDDEMGLWYRLAPVTFMGETLNGTGPGRAPTEPAALGSVVVHGPHTEGHGDAYGRLRRVGAQCAVDSGGALGHVIDRLQAPDKAAELANSAWSVITSGAEATDQALALLNEMLNRSDS